jgi:PTH1 family peptidyl-tRNA hydrolase
MRLIVFLGNPGLKYRKTRHNIGFMVGDFYAKAHNAKWQKFIKFQAETAEFTENGNKVLLIKPQKFYNLTGEVVQKFINFYKISAKDLLVVCDDLNLDFGKLRFREQGSDGGNNGLASVIGSLRTDGFARLRIGTNNALRAQMGDITFVLSKFSRDEKQQLPEIFEQVAQKIDEFNRNMLS